MNLLHLDASARPQSVSRELGAEFAAAYRESDPTTSYVHRDLSRDPVPHIDAAWTEICDTLMCEGITDLHRLHEGARTPAQLKAWSVVQPLLDEVIAADVILIGTPMYNFSVPSALKAWIDQVTFPRMSLADRRLVVVGARGGDYRPGAPRAPFDHQVSYLRDFFAGHFAVSDATFIVAELANARVDPHLRERLAEHEQSVAETIEAARDVARVMAGGRP
ncbi:FMN-dependent NADH-azoreductase [Aeromicrobium sp. Root236]|uniref:FMN-dependent NADH-azoreductase n=1 Tax=Aeromicrobium sp. Root236 TaxID=1736498 RepID=UPI0006F46720|nr:NAD(P)H-dependent oxidoreductase [Aeromicrobium sp. Root236]KRC64498.1 FMN-dependent NADH-azoreductase [Aeromicrobium sp. Root236]